MAEKLANLSVDLLVPAFVLLRLVDKTSLDYIEMRDSMAAHGFFGTICVRPSKRQPGKYEIIDGLHRYCCAVDCGLKEVPCIIKEATDAEVKNWQIQANIIRRETANSDYAARLKMLFIENPQLTMEILAVELHCRPAKIQAILRLNRLIPKAKQHLDIGELPITSAYSLAKLPKKLQEDLLEKALTLSVREFIQISNGYRKAYQEAVNEGRLQKYLYLPVKPKPHLRTFKMVRNEYEHLTAGKILVKDSEKLEVWKLALAWVLQLDSLSQQEIQKKADKRADSDRQRIASRKKDLDRRLRSKASKMGADPDDDDMIEVVI